MSVSKTLKYLYDLRFISYGTLRARQACLIHTMDFFQNFFFSALDWEFFLANWEKKILFGIGNGAKFRPQIKQKRNTASKLKFLSMSKYLPNFITIPLSTDSQRKRVSLLTWAFQGVTPVNIFPISRNANYHALRLSQLSANIV